MAYQSRTNQAGLDAAGSDPEMTGGWRAAWIALVAVIVLMTYGSCGQMLKFMYFAPGSAGTTGVTYARDPTVPGTVIVHSLKSGSVLADAGIRDGDRVRLDYPWDDLRMPKAGERFGLTKLSGSKPQHITVRLPAAAPIPDADKFFSSLTPVGNMTIALIGLLVVIRSRGDRSAMLLGTGFALVGPIPPYLWPIPPDHVPYWHMPVWIGIAMLPWFLLGFVMTYVEKMTGKLPAWQKTVFWVLTGVQVLTCTYEIFDTLLNLALPGMAVVRPLNYLLQIIGLVVPVYFLAVGWLRSPPEIRARFAVMFVALPITFVSQSIYVIATLFGSVLVDLKSPFIIAAGLGIFIGPLLFTYAVFRHKVLDIGFAVNRTLVYGAVSAILLVAFGLAEWAFEHFLPFENRETGVLVDAGLALAVFLVFHRVRDFVEHHIEAFFFHKWHQNEARLRTFVGEAGFIGKTAALTQGFITELARFSGGAVCDLYLARGADFVDLSGTEMDGDMPVLITLQASRAAVECDNVLYLPMLQRGSLTGFVRMGLKPSGERCRPDERDVLAWATQQIGLDLHALEVERLQTENAVITASRDLLAAKYDDLRGMTKGLLKGAKT